MLLFVIWNEVTMFIEENQSNFTKCALWSSFEDDVVTNEASTCKHFNCSFPSENEDKNHLYEPFRKCNCESLHVVKKFSANHVFVYNLELIYMHVRRHYHRTSKLLHFATKCNVESMRTIYVRFKSRNLIRWYFAIYFFSLMSIFL